MGAPPPRLLQKLRWQSRRGLLELDLLLDKFWQNCGELTAEDLAGLEKLLSLDDEDLQAAIASGGDGLPPAARRIAKKVRG